MGKKFVQIAAFLLAMLILPAPTAGAQPEEGGGQVIRVGLFYGSSALPGANLLNSVGSGYRFGYDDGSGFCQLGFTQESAVSMVKTQNVYYTSHLPDGLYGYSDEVTTDVAVGCYHLALPGSYESFEQVRQAADAVGGFPAWIDGSYQVRIGAYTSKESAQAAMDELGLADAAVAGTSSYGITVVVTGGGEPIFQYDGGEERPMFIVKPGVDDTEKTVTHFKGYKYYGSFRYERINGGDLTVVNLIPLEDYIKGVIPYEMSPGWPLEALKAQAVCARNYAMVSLNRHPAHHFDVCTTTECQVYYGTARANETTDRAVEETMGMYAWYGGELIESYYHSCDGGATENVENVWISSLPYLRGVEDPYEDLVAEQIPNYHWTRTYTGKQLQERFNKAGFLCGEIVDLRVSKFTETGNVYSVTFTDVNGKSWTVSKDSNVRSMMGASSLRYTIASGGDGYFLTGGGNLGALSGAWALNGEGEAEQIGQSTFYAVTGGGVEAVAAPENPDGTFTLTGTGKGHNLGMSQWGAYAMAQEGYTYEDILKFYFTGIEIHQ